MRLNMEEYIILSGMSNACLEVGIFPFKSQKGTVPQHAWTSPGSPSCCRRSTRPSSSPSAGCRRCRTSCCSESTRWSTRSSCSERWASAHQPPSTTCGRGRDQPPWGSARGADQQRTLLGRLFFFWSYFLSSAHFRMKVYFGNICKQLGFKYHCLIANRGTTNQVGQSKCIWNEHNHHETFLRQRTSCSSHRTSAAWAPAPSARGTAGSRATWAARSRSWRSATWSRSWRSASALSAVREVKERMLKHY